MRNLSIVVFFFAVVLAGSAAEFNLIPWPAKLLPATGEFSWDNQTVVLADTVFTNEAALLAGQTHLRRANNARKNRIFLTTQGADGLGEEAYRLEVDNSGAIIRAESPAGAFYGVQTLLQLLGPKPQNISAVTIEDQPRYVWRGLMLDVSRHFFDQPTILHMLDWMAAYKFNRFHLHLADDQGWRLEVGKYPELTRIGARGNYSDTNAPARFFTKSELQEIVRYAAQRHIVVVPEIDMPGHASAAVRSYPFLDGGSNTFNPASDRTYDFLKDVVAAEMEIFPSPWIHFGGDEVNRSQWQVTDKLTAAGIKTPAQMEGYFVRRMSDFIAQQGRTPMGWDEIVTARPVTNTIVFWWRHNKPELLEQALAAGYSVVLTPRSPCYFDYPQDKSYPQTGWKLCNTPEVVYRGPLVSTNVPSAQLKQILGVECCLWTEHIGTTSYLEFMALPRLAAFGEMAWTPDASRNYARFDACLKPFLEQYRQAGIHFYDAANPQESRRKAMTPIAPTASR